MINILKYTFGYDKYLYHLKIKRVYGEKIVTKVIHNFKRVGEISLIRGGGGDGDLRKVDLIGLFCKNFGMSGSNQNVAGNYRYTLKPTRSSKTSSSK